jgi:hypothetical protein
LNDNAAAEQIKEFIRCLKGIWIESKFSFAGDFYQFYDYPLQPKPLKWEGRPHQEIFQGGNSIDARENAATVSDYYYYFMNGNSERTFSCISEGKVSTAFPDEDLVTIYLLRLIFPDFDLLRGTCPIKNLGAQAN